MADMARHTISELLLQRKINELERKVWELQHLIPATDYHKITENPEVFDMTVKMHELTPVLHLASMASLEPVGEYGGFNIKGTAYNLKKGTLSIGHYIDSRIETMPDHTRLDYLVELIDQLVKGLADTYARK